MWCAYLSPTSKLKLDTTSLFPLNLSSILWVNNWDVFKPVANTISGGTGFMAMKKHTPLYWAFMETLGILNSMA